MAISEPEFPPLTPAEALVLLDPRASQPTEAFKVAFLSLVAQGVLSVAMTDKIGLFRTRQVPMVRLAREPPRDAAHISAVVDAVAKAQTFGAAAAMPAIAKAAVKALGAGLARFKKDLILPGLVQRGLLRPETEAYALVFTRTAHVHTPAGLVEKGRLEAIIAQAKRLPQLLQSDPKEAAAIALAAGGLVLLVPELKRHYGELAALNTPSGGDVIDASSWDGGGAPGAWSFDFGSFDTHSLSALDMDFSSFDASFDSSFSDSGGGGDSGGGDGGGGGGD